MYIYIYVCVYINYSYHQFTITILKIDCVNTPTLGSYRAGGDLKRQQEQCWDRDCRWVRTRWGKMNQNLAGVEHKTLQHKDMHFHM